MDTAKGKEIMIMIMKRKRFVEKEDWGFEDIK